MYYSFYVSLLKKNLQKTKTNTSTLFLLMPPGRLLEHHTGFIISPPRPQTPPDHGVPPGPIPRPHSALDVYVMSLNVAKNFFKRRPRLLEYGCVILVLYCILSSH